MCRVYELQLVAVITFLSRVVAQLMYGTTFCSLHATYVLHGLVLHHQNSPQCCLTDSEEELNVEVGKKNLSNHLNMKNNTVADPGGPGPPLDPKFEASDYILRPKLHLLTHK